MEAFFHISFFHNTQNVFAGNHRCIRTGGSRKLVFRVVEHREAEHPFLMPKIGKFLLLLLFFLQHFVQEPPCYFDSTQERIQGKLEGGAVGSGGAEKFSKIGDESTLSTTISDPFSE